MKIKYRAVHERNCWRKVSIHKTLNSAIDGPDGAKSLLLRRGRIAAKWEEYGAPRCVFVWEDGAMEGFALRLKPGNFTEVEFVSVPVHKLEQFDSLGGCSDGDSEACFHVSRGAH